MFRRLRIRQAVSPVEMTSAQVKGLITLKSLYFFFFAGIGVYFTFINVYYRSIGLSGVQIGLINTVGPLVAIFGMIGWGLLNDWLGKTRLLFGIAVLGTILSALGISAVTAFTAILPLVCLYSLFNSPISPLIDSTTLSVLGENRDRYGMQRVWGSFGFILTSFSAGFLFERLGLHVIFIFYSVVMAFLLLASFGLPQQPIRLGGSPFAGLGQMLRQPLWLLFAASIFVLGLAISGMLSFLAVAMKVMGASESLIGISSTMAAASEIPIMLFSAVLLRRAGSLRLLAIAFFVYGVRAFLYSIMPSPEWVPYINLLNGASFGIFWIGAVTYANDLAPENLKTTAQSMMFSTINLAFVVGAVSSGWLFDQFGPAGLFQVLTVCCLLALLLFVTGHLFLKRRRQPAAG